MTDLDLTAFSAQNRRYCAFSYKLKLIRESYVSGTRKIKPLHWIILQAGLSRGNPMTRKISWEWSSQPISWLAY